MAISQSGPATHRPRGRFALVAAETRSAGLVALALGLLVTGLVVVLDPPAGSPAGAAFGRTEWVSVGTGEDPGRHHATDDAVSDDGRYVVFDSDAPLADIDSMRADLPAYGHSGPPGGVPLDRDVYLRDRHLDTTILISSGFDAGSRDAVISGDGRFIAFLTAARTTFAPVPLADDNGQVDAVVVDRGENRSWSAKDTSGLTLTRVPNVSSDVGAPAYDDLRNDSTDGPVVDVGISDDGRHVALVALRHPSEAAPTTVCLLQPKVVDRDVDGDGSYDQHHQLGATRFTSLGVGQDSCRGASTIDISANGAFLVFDWTDREPLPVKYAVIYEDVARVSVYERDLDRDGSFAGDADSRRHDLVSARSSSLAEATISDDGRVVGYTDDPGPADETAVDPPSQVMMIDRAQAAPGGTVTPQLVSKAAGDVPGDGPSRQPDLSGDGRYLAAATDAGNLPGACSSDPPIGVEARAYPAVRCSDVLLWDLADLSVEPIVISVAADGGGADGPSVVPSVSASGRFVSFLSEAAGLDADQDGANDDHDPDVFIREVTPTLIGSPDPTDFDEVAIGSGVEATRVVTFTNATSDSARGSWGPLTVDAVRVDGPFVVVRDDCTGVTLHRGETCQVRVGYEPDDTGVHTGTVRAIYEGDHWRLEKEPAAAERAVVQLTGEAYSQIFTATPDPVTFGAVRTDAAPPERDLRIGNAGSRAFVIHGIRLEGVDATQFSVTRTDCVEVLEPRSSCEVTVRFAPTAQGTDLATLIFDDTAPGSPHRVGLRGSGVVGTAALEVTPNPVDFGESPVGAALPDVDVLVTNRGDADFTVTALDLVGPASADFSIVATTCRGATVAPDGACTVSLRASPALPGHRPAQLRLGSTAPGQPHLVDLRVVGAVPTLIFNPGLGPPGAVVTAIGAGWPVGRPVSVTFPGHVGEFVVIAGPDGSFVNPNVVIMPRSQIGARVALASTTTEAGAPIAAFSNFLVVTPTVDGMADFVYRK